jgi:hypothetical protein
MSKAIFDRETAICRDLHNDNGGSCNWGECDKCGVIPFMYKIFNDEYVEDLEGIKRIKKEVFGREV